MSKLKEGDKVPLFEAYDQDGNLVNINNFIGKKVLIYFYPKANTPGCTTQSCSVEAARKEFYKFGISVIGISPDNQKKQKKFAEKYNLNFPLLCDEDHSITESFGVWKEKKMFGNSYMGVIRSSFLIDETGIILKVWYKISPKNTIPYAKTMI